MDTQGHWGLQHTRTHTHTENSARRKNRRSKIKWKGERKREEVSRAAESRQKGGGSGEKCGATGIPQWLRDPVPVAQHGKDSLTASLTQTC